MMNNEWGRGVRWVLREDIYQGLGFELGAE